MFGTKNKSLAEYARSMRNNMTQQEKKLWFLCLKKTRFVVKRQRQIGAYIVDFYCPKAKLVIEVDGAQHFTRGGKCCDVERDAFLKSLGIVVMRFTNAEVDREFEKVCWTIHNYMESVV